VEHISLLSSIGLKAMVAPIAVFNPAIQRQMNKSRALRCTGPMLFLSSTLAYDHLICSGAYFVGSSIGLGAMAGPIAVFNPAIQRKMKNCRGLQCTGLMLL
jgi:hypothetical protein